jgi:hypothetical protein
MAVKGQLSGTQLIQDLPRRVALAAKEFGGALEAFVNPHSSPPFRRHKSS